MLKNDNFSSESHIGRQDVSGYRFNNVNSPANNNVISLMLGKEIGQSLDKSSLNNLENI